MVNFFSALPDETVLNILEYVPDLKNVSVADKRLRELSLDSKLGLSKSIEEAIAKERVKLVVGDLCLNLGPTKYYNPDFVRIFPYKFSISKDGKEMEDGVVYLNRKDQYEQYAAAMAEGVRAVIERWRDGGGSHRIVEVLENELKSEVQNEIPSGPLCIVM